MKEAVAMSRPFRIRSLASAFAAILVLAALPGAGAAAAPVARCVPGGPLVEFRGMVSEADARTYAYLPFNVVKGTTRIEVGYEWSENSVVTDPLDETTLDLGLRESGLGASAGFRGWSGSNQAKLHEGQPRVFVQSDAASRSYMPGPIRPGTWNIELGIAAVSSVGAAWRVEVACSSPVTGPAPQPDPVDPDHVARGEAGWYDGDLHQHGYHSTPTGPSYADLVLHARMAGLDFVPVTEYVIGQHWNELGAVQRANPDLLIWPGREVITYQGHAIVLGETDSLEYRQGLKGISLGRIQRESVAQGALFQVAHPTFFPPPFDKYCRGCFFGLGGEIDWSMVTTLEVLTGPVIVDPRPFLPYPLIQNPFTESAIELWEAKLLEGYRITAVSGSDDKSGFGIGVNATSVYASELSRTALQEALRAGHAYIRTLGTGQHPFVPQPNLSPVVEMTATTADGQAGMYGDSLAADEAQVTIRVVGGLGQMLEIVRNGVLLSTVLITSADFVHTFTAARSPDEGPLGTFWRIQTRISAIPGVVGPVLTSIGNPIFLTGESAAA
jgi:hypothetical protein